MVCLSEARLLLPAGSWVCFLHFLKKGEVEDLNSAHSQGEAEGWVLPRASFQGEVATERGPLGNTAILSGSVALPPWVTTRLGFRPQGYLGYKPCRK